MLETSKWIYLDLEKTGSTFLRKKLLDIYPISEFLITKKHLPQTKKSTKIKIITIRDPFNYYFSLWSYGLERKGGIYYNLLKRNLVLCENIYKDKTKKNFELFLAYVLNSPIINSNNWLPKGLDIYSQRIMNMIVPNEQTNLFSRKSSKDEIKTLVKEHFIPEIIIKTESLNADFHELADSGDLEFLNLPKSWKVYFPLEEQKDNASKLSSTGFIKEKFKKEFGNLINNESYVANLLI